VSNTRLFSTVACEYSLFRPGYPEELFEWLARAAPRPDAAWDCGCGSGQASVPLAAHFSHVFATDAAAEQLAAPNGIRG
jgi:tRNA/tmRNA/rRNA uracil-C5-methylase (TrmA/RlmC/RlmD family)